MDEHTILVKGIGNIKAKPDIIILSLTLTTTTPEYIKTTELAALELETLRKAFISTGHEESTLKTTSFNIHAEYEHYNDAYGNRRQKFKGYSCVHCLKLEFDLDMKLLGETLAAMSETKTNPRFEINFSIKDKNAIQADLLENAVFNAMEKASILAKASGVSLGNIKHINYSWGELHVHSRAEYSTIDSIIAPCAIKIEPEEVEVNDTVTVVWEIQ